MLQNGVITNLSEIQAGRLLQISYQHHHLNTIGYKAEIDQQKDLVRDPLGQYAVSHNKGTREMPVYRLIWYSKITIFYLWHCAHSLVLLYFDLN